MNIVEEMISRKREEQYLDRVWSHRYGAPSLYRFFNKCFDSKIIIKIFCYLCWIEQYFIIFHNHHHTINTIFSKILAVAIFVDNIFVNLKQHSYDLQIFDGFIRNVRTKYKIFRRSTKLNRTRYEYFVLSMNVLGGKILSRY